MQNDEQLLKNRFSELSARAFTNGRYTYSEFLTLAQQQTLFSMSLEAPFELCGGFDGAERRVAAFGSESLCGYAAEPPVACVKIKPASQKFAQALTHRDCLGSLMALGLRREVLGDIIIYENEAFLFCLEGVADYVVQALERVSRTAVKCLRCLPPAEVASPPPRVCEFVVASQRLDAVTAAVYNLSRSESQRLFEQKKIYINSRLCENASYALKPGDTVSVRGFGRFRFEGVKLETRKGRLRITAGVF